MTWQFLQMTILGNALWRWITVPIVTIAAIFILKILRGFLVRKLREAAEKTETTIDDLLANLIEDTRMILIIILALSIASTFIDFGDAFAEVMCSLSVIALFIQAAIWVNRLALYLLKTYFEKREGDGRAGKAAIATVGYLIRIVVWSIALLLILDNIPGVEVNSLIASLGIAGVATALAVQNILGDLFASLSIIFDQPFSVGDFITAGQIRGKIEKVGLKSTRIRSLFGEEIIISNSNLLNMEIHNFGNLEQRRYAFDIGVAYNTPIDQLEKIPSYIKNIIESIDDVEFSRANLRELGSSSIMFEIETYVTRSEFEVYMKIREQVNLKIMRKFEEEGIEFPFPTMTVQLEQAEQRDTPLS